MKIHPNIGKKVILLAAVAVLLVLFFSLMSGWEKRHGAISPNDADEADDGRIYVDGTTYVPNSDLEVILLIGVDKYGEQEESETESDSYNNNQQADFLMLVIVDEEKQTYTLFHLNRDAITDIPVLGVRGEAAGTITGQLALAHTYGSGGRDSCRNTEDAVSNLLYGEQVDHFLAFTMDAVAQINDLAGGVTVTLADDMTFVSPDWTEGTTITLDGEDALSYVRTRYGLEDSSNLKRMERQRQYVAALKSALAAKAETDEDFMTSALNTVSPYLTTDYTVNQLSRLYDRMKTYTDGGIQYMEGEAVQGEEYMEFYPDETALRQQVLQLFYLPLEEAS